MLLAGFIYKPAVFVHPSQNVQTFETLLRTILVKAYQFVSPFADDDFSGDDSHYIIPVALLWQYIKFELSIILRCLRSFAPARLPRRARPDRVMLNG